MKTGTVCLQYVPHPWRPEDAYEIGQVTSTGEPNGFSTTWMDTLETSADDQARHLFRFIGRVDLLARELARENGGVLDLDMLMQEILDRGSAIRLTYQEAAK